GDVAAGALGARERPAGWSAAQTRRQPGQARLTLRLRRLPAWLVSRRDRRGRQNNDSFSWISEGGEPTPQGEDSGDGCQRCINLIDGSQLDRVYPASLENRFPPLALAPDAFRGTRRRQAVAEDDGASVGEDLDRRPGDIPAPESPVAPTARLVEDFESAPH